MVVWQQVPVHALAWELLDFSTQLGTAELCHLPPVHSLQADKPGLQPHLVSGVVLAMHWSVSGSDIACLHTSRNRRRPSPFRLLLCRPQYSPTSPQYSPTSPQYSPTS